MRKLALTLADRANTTCEGSLEGIPFQSFKKIPYNYGRYMLSRMRGDNYGITRTLVVNQHDVHIYRIRNVRQYIFIGSTIAFSAL